MKRQTGRDLRATPDTALPIACSLDGEAFSRRLVTVQDLLRDSETCELPNGYELSFPGDTKSFERVAEFVRTERECCTFLRFVLIAEPGKTAIRLRLEGGPDVKKFVGALLPALSPGD